LKMGLKVFLDVAWPKNLSFIDDDELMRQALDAVRHAAKSCGNHEAIFAISVVNEIPSDLVRYYGRERVEQFVDELVATAKSEAPQCLVTFANFPTTEYLQPRDIDFVCFNVYLHDENVFRNYLARLQNISGEKPLMLGEYGIDTHREKTEEEQATILGNHIRAVFDEGLAGTFIFSYTDDWFTHGWRITDWKFGIVRQDRTPKPAFAAVKQLFHRVPQVADVKLPKMSVIICSYNGASTVESCLRSMQRIRTRDDCTRPNMRTNYQTPRAACGREIIEQAVGKDLRRPRHRRPRGLAVGGRRVEEPALAVEGEVERERDLRLGGDAGAQQDRAR